MTKLTRCPKCHDTLLAHRQDKTTCLGCDAVWWLSKTGRTIYGRRTYPSGNAMITEHYQGKMPDKTATQ